MNDGILSTIKILIETEVIKETSESLSFDKHIWTWQLFLV
jgi:hypothetical protein